MKKIRNRFRAFVNNFKITLAVYSLFGFGKKRAEKFAAVVIINPLCSKGGVADRFKTVVSMYQFARHENIPFRILHTYPYNLSDFLLPNSYDWLPKTDEVSLNLRDAKPYFNWHFCFMPVEKLVRTAKTKKQIHGYFKMDFNDDLNQMFGTSDTWGSLFLELFRPADELANLINFHKRQMGKPHIALHFRFIGLLGDFKDVRSHKTDDPELLIEKNLQKIREIAEQFHENAVYVASDSEKFNSRAAEIPNVYALRGKVAHIVTGGSEKHETYLRNFLDFFLIAESERVFSIGTDDMYMGGNFSRYAAKVYDIPFEKICL